MRWTLYKERVVYLYGTDEELIEDALALNQMGCIVNIITPIGINELPEKITEVRQIGINVIEKTEILEAIQNAECHIKDDFETIYNKLVEANVIILGSPVYWANISGVMKNFFDRHTGYAMYKSPDAMNFYKLSNWEKIKTIISLMKKFGPIDPRFRQKKYILITASTIPFKHLLGEVPLTIHAMKKYVAKLRGKVISKIIFTDTLFQFSKKKEAKIMNKAYLVGKYLNEKRLKISSKGIRKEVVFEIVGTV